MSMQKTVLISGGAGFVGSNLSKTLINEGARVDCVDNLITGRVESIESLMGNESFRFFQKDITDPTFYETFKNNNYDEIFHLACPTGVPNIDILGEEMLRTCSVGTENVLKIAQYNGSKLVYTSSAEVYGDPQVFPQHEGYHGSVNPIGPRSAYEEGKRFAEALAVLYARKYKVETKIVRIFNTFGLGMSPEDLRVIPQFLQKIREKEKIVIYGDGEQIRTHLYIDDLIAGLLLVMDRGNPGDVYNIGGNKQTSIKELYETFQNLVEDEVEVEYKPHFIEDHSSRLPDTEKVRSLGWMPRVELRDGLVKMLLHNGIALNHSHTQFNAAQQPSSSFSLQKNYQFT